MSALTAPVAKQHRELWPEGYTVVIVAPFPPPYGGMSLQANQLFHLLKQEKVSVRQIDINQKLHGLLSFIERIFIVRTIVHFVLFVIRVWKSALPDTVFHIFSNSYASFFLWTATTTLIGRKRGVPVIINYRGGLADEFLKKWRIPASLIFRQASKVIVPSRYLESVFLQNCVSTQVIPNMIMDGLPQRPAREFESPHIVVNRNLEPIYNIECALRAFALIQTLVPQARLTLIGEGSQRLELEMSTKNFGLRNVTFAGRLTNHEVIRLLHHCDVLLNPTDVDNMPISVIEAMAIGIPVVSTNVGGIPYLIENEVNGILVEKNDHQALAQAALRIMKSSALRNRLVKNAKRQADDFRWKKVWPLWRLLYLTLYKHQ